jgi:hypothetical protein
MLIRRIADAKESVEASRKAQLNLIATAEDGATKQRVQLIEHRRTLQVSLEALASALNTARTNALTAGSSDPTVRLAQLRDEMTKASIQSADLNNSINATAENLRRLNVRLNDLKQQASDAQSKSVQNLRLPKERTTGKRVFNVIVQHGKLYPLLTADLERNSANIAFSAIGDGITAQPLSNAGYDPVRSSAWRQLLSSLSKSEFYIAFYVFEDSFGAFNQAKRATVQSGFEYGWDPTLLKDGPLSFGKRGSRPGVQ